MKRAGDAVPRLQPTAKVKAQPAQPPAACEAPQQGRLRCGPTSLCEAFAWPADMLEAVCRDVDRSRRLSQMITKTWRVSSDYSGLRTEEVCFDALAGALKKKYGKELRHSFLYSCDNDATCQSVTLGTAQDRKPQHCFKDMNCWLTAEARDRLDKAEELLPKLKPDACKVDKRNILKQRADLYHDMGKWLLDNIDSVIRNQCDCLQHMQECEIDFKEPDETEITLEVAGLTCIAWSNFGKHEGFAHQSMRPFFIWACLMRKRKPSILVVESAQRFPRDSLQDFLGDLYHFQFFDHNGPIDHGWPITRPRMYGLGFLRKRLTFLGSQSEYREIFGRNCFLDGHSLFFLKHDDPEVLREKALLAKSRRMQLIDKVNPPWDKLYPPNKQGLIKEHRKMYEQKFGAMLDHDDPPAYICDLDQNLGFSSPGKNWPCLVRHGTIFSIPKNRHATPGEVFAAQGFPVHPSCQFAASYKCGFQQVYEQDLSRNDSHKLCGNAMFVPTLASMILYAMCSVELEPAKLIRPSSTLFSDVEDSQERH